MEPNLFHLISLLNERLQALHALAGEIKAGQQALVSLDLESLQSHDARKEQICNDIRRLDRKVTGILNIIAPKKSLRSLADEIQAKRNGNELRTASQLRQLLEESGAAGAEVARLNKEYGEFLRRSRGTLNVLTNVVFHCLGVYPPPIASSSSFLERSL